MQKIKSRKNDTPGEERTQLKSTLRLLYHLIPRHRK